MCKPLAAHINTQHIINFEREDYVGSMLKAQHHGTAVDISTKILTDNEVKWTMSVLLAILANKEEAST